MKHKHRAFNGRYMSISKVVELALGATIILAVGAWHVVDANNALEANLESMRGNVFELQVRAGELEIQAAQSNLAVVHEVIVQDKNAEALASLDEYERALIQKESSFRTTAKNPKSSAFGLFQLLDYNRVKYARIAGVENPDTTEAYEQIAMGRAYIAHRYDNAKIAYFFHVQNSWY
tara:strand:+ start:26363 stop:26893 length:531 start_codon:yes stop_codon:yes gene_type:complete